MNHQDTFIDSAASVQKVLLEEHQMEKKQSLIRSVMRDDLDMRFRKVLPVSIHANSWKNLVLRQQFALKYIELLFKDKIILNIDETWLGMCDFRRMKWQAPAATNSVAKLQMQPRITMIVGLDSRGQVYVSLLQSNSNVKVMEIFFHSLVRVLDKERKGWREDTIILVDNARYHAADGTQKVFKALRIPIMFTGPHSYEAAPCELFFAAFKREDINPRRVSTGKK